MRAASQSILLIERRADNGKSRKKEQKEMGEEEYTDLVPETVDDKVS